MKTKAVTLLGLGVLGVLGWFNWATSEQVARSYARVAQGHQVRANLARLLAAVQDVQMGQRGYLLTADRQFLTPYTFGTEQIDVQYDRLLRLTRDNPQQQSRLQAVKPLLEQKVAHARDTIALRDAAGLEAAQREVASGKGQAMTDTIRLALQEMEQDEAASLIKRAKFAQRAARLNNGTILASVSLGLLFLIVVGFVLGRARPSEAQVEVSPASEPKSPEVSPAKHVAPTQPVAAKPVEVSQPVVAQLADASTSSTEKTHVDKGTSKRHRKAAEAPKPEVEEQPFQRATTPAVAAAPTGPEFQPHSLNALIEHVVATLAPAAEVQQITLSQQLAQDLPDVPLDVSRISDVLMNLVTNSLKFTNAGGHILVTSSQHSADFLHVSVIDNGCGMSAEQVANIFEPGKVANAAHTGAGLPTSREYVLLHGGEIWVQSELGKGSAVTFSLPLRQGTASAAPKPHRKQGNNVTTLPDEVEQFSWKRNDKAA